jgi:membrane protein DedA with SNARE-associated domain
MVASAIWYGALVWIGGFAGRNIDSLLQLQSRLNWTLTVIAAVIGALLVWWWVHSRRAHASETDPGSDPGERGDESS